jgi:CBS domain-containing protein
MQVRDVMTDAVVTVEPTAPVGEAARIMRDANVGALPVMVEGDRDIHGIVTDRDIVVRCIAVRSDPEITAVEDIMTRDLVYCYDDEDAVGAAIAMQDRGVQRFLVIERESDRLKGIVSLADLAVRSDDPEVPLMVLHDLSERRRAA